MFKKYVFLISVLLISGCSDSYELYNYFYFDTPISVRIYDNSFDKKAIKDSIDEILKENEQQYSVYKDDSTISKLNTQRSLEVDSEFSQLLLKSKKYCKITDSRYNVASGELIDLWSISDNNYIPTIDEINSAAMQNCDNYEVKNNIVTLKDDAMLNLGSVVKGSTGDEIVSLLKSNNINKALINIGGNVVTLGNKKYNVGIDEPSIDGDGSPVMSVHVSDKSVVTSGINQRYFVNNDVLYHHLLDAKKGYPHNSEVESVTVIADSSTEADMLSTSLFLMDFDQSFEYSKSLEDIYVVYITKDNKIYINNDSLEYEILNKDYIVI